MNKKKNAKPRKIVIEDIDTNLLKKITGGPQEEPDQQGAGGSQGCSDTNSCTCACAIDNQYSDY